MRKRIEMPVMAKHVATAKNVADAIILTIYSKDKIGKRYKMASGYYAEL